MSIASDAERNKSNREAYLAARERGTNSLQNMTNERAEGVALLRPHFPGESAEDLYWRSVAVVWERHRKGHWPSTEELARMAAEAAEEVAGP